VALKRIIARLDIKNATVIKGIMMEGLRVVGSPVEMARSYYENGVDEILYIDAVASLYGRSSLFDLVKESARQVFVPMTVGGGIRSIEDATRMLECGAEKIAINTAAVADPDLIDQLARRFGSQCVVGSVHAKKIGDGKYEAYTEYGRERVELNLIQWCQELESRGAGELLLTCIDRDGRKLGFDQDLLSLIAADLKIPLVCSGGISEPGYAAEAFLNGADGVAIASALHYKTHSIHDFKTHCTKFGIGVRLA